MLGQQASAHCPRGGCLGCHGAGVTERAKRLCSRWLQAGQRGVADALSLEAARLGGSFDALEARIEEAKSRAAAACQPMSGERKVCAS